MSDTTFDVIDAELADYDEKEDAFFTWVELGRNARQTGIKLDIPPRTIQDWVTRYGWRERYRTMIDGMLGEKVQEVRLAYANAMHTAASRLLTDVGNPDLSPHDVRLHVELLMKVSQGNNVQGEVGTAPTFIDARQVHLGPHDVRPVDPRTLATQAIEANIAASEVRKEGRRGRQ